MRKPISSVALGLLIAAVAGCSSDGPPPARVAVPDQPSNQPPPPRYAKPMPPANYPEDVPPPPFDDVAIVSQQAPETPAFIAAYNAVGRPRICVFVNRTLQGETLPVNPNDPLISVEHTQSTNAGVTVDHSTNQTRDGFYEHSNRTTNDKFQSNGPAQYKEKTELYLQPGQYDEVAAKSLDYEAVENILTDFLSADGQVTIMSPTLVRQKLTPEQVKELESGQPQVASQIVQQLGADILVQVAAHPTHQTQQGLQVRLVCESMNIKGGQSLGHAVVDINPPLEKTQINKFTRFCARKLMSDMTKTWSAPPPAPSNVPAATPMDKPAPPPQTPAKSEPNPMTLPATLPEKQ